MQRGSDGPVGPPGSGAADAGDPPIAATMAPSANARTVRVTTLVIAVLPIKDSSSAHLRNENEIRSVAPVRFTRGRARRPCPPCPCVRPSLPCPCVRRCRAYRYPCAIPHPSRPAPRYAFRPVRRKAIPAAERWVPSEAERSADEPAERPAVEPPEDGPAERQPAAPPVVLTPEELPVAVAAGTDFRHMQHLLGWSCTQGPKGRWAAEAHRATGPPAAHRGRRGTPGRSAS